MRRMLSITIVGLLAFLAAGQDPPEPPRDQGQFRLQQHVTRLFRSLSQLSDWDTHSGYITSAMEKTYERNGWTSEPDQFALNMITEVNKVPPWKPEERFDRAADMLADRYDLDSQQQQLLRETLIRESNDLFQKHSGRIMQYAIEAIQTRAAGEPFTPEQVARWTQLAEPVFLDSRERMNIAAEAFAANLRDDQAEALRADLDAANRRMDDLYIQGQRWREGAWDPLDWGLEDDPIQTGANGANGKTAQEQGEAGDEPAPGQVQRGQPRAGEQQQAAQPKPGQAASRPADEDAWAQYVRRFIEKYKLNDTQQTTAWRIYRDVKARGDAQRNRYSQQIDTVRRRASTTKDEKAQTAAKNLEGRLNSQLEQLFEQLKIRLEKIPTRQQRADAGPDKLEPPAPPPPPAPVNPMPHDGP